MRIRTFDVTKLCVYVYNSSMPRRDTYLNEEEYAFVGKKPRGFMRKLVQAAMSGDMRISEESTDSVYTHPLKETLDEKMEQIAKDRAKENVNACKYCGRIKVAGKCLTCKK